MSTDETTAGPPPTGSPQRSPQQSIVQARSPKHSIVKTSYSNVPPSALPPVKLKSSSKGPDSSTLMSPPKDRGALCHIPVTARAPKDMVGAHMERSTGITYPYNMWGPCNPGKHGQEFPAIRSQKNHYEGEHVSLARSPSPTSQHS